jgi:hypothetical protein
MTRYGTRRAGAALMVIAGALSGCVINAAPNAANPPATAAPAKPPASPDVLNMKMPNRPGGPVVYTWHKHDYEGAANLLLAVQAEVTASLDKVKPSVAPPFGSLRVAFAKMPPPNIVNEQNPAGVAEVKDAYVSLWQAIDDGRLKALQKSGLFSSITNETANIDILDPGSADFALWREGGWHLRYRKGNPHDIGNMTDVALWLGYVTIAARTAKSDLPGAFSLHTPNTPNKGKVWFTWEGTDYFAVEPLVPLMDAEFMQQAGDTERLSGRIGGKVKIVLATFDAATTNVAATDPENVRLSREALKAYGRAVANGRVEALRRSKIFDSITVETADVSDVPVAGYDYVLWESATNPYSWRYRIAGKGDAYSLVTPTGTTVSKFPAVVRDAIRDGKTTP